jgi:hypothetical protein
MPENVRFAPQKQTNKETSRDCHKPTYAVSKQERYSITSSAWQGQRPKHVRFAPKADKEEDASPRPLCANRDPTQRSK